MTENEEFAFIKIQIKNVNREELEMIGDRLVNEVTELGFEIEDFQYHV